MATAIADMKKLITSDIVTTIYPLASSQVWSSARHSRAREFHLPATLHIAASFIDRRNRKIKATTIKSFQIPLKQPKLPYYRTT
jgi:hypothetical protein